ncbi:helix-turn-helix domain-containing protein [Olsenella uli]|uniref:helix-turn-helix domain-containing protein n=1 Tax=Olsenella uli TaxID=133926 RepID=UPI00241D591E|nr:helix-turn-helix transcriptional regulator [Olsenella uli]
MAPCDTMRGIRVMRGMSRSDAAERVGVTAETIGRWERGDSEPTRPYLISMARAYGVTIDQLVGMTELISTT